MTFPIKTIYSINPKFIYVTPTLEFFLTYDSRYHRIESNGRIIILGRLFLKKGTVVIKNSKLLRRLYFNNNI